MHRLSKCAGRKVYAQLAHTSLRGRVRLLWQPQRTFSAAPGLRKNDEDDDDDGFRFYEQVAPGKQGIRRVTRQYLEDVEERTLKAKVEELEKELRNELKSEEFSFLSNDQPQQAVGASEEVLDSNDEDQTSTSVEDKDVEDKDVEDADVDDLLDDSELQGLFVDYQIRQSSQVQLKKFNTLVRKFALGNSPPELAHDLWTRYLRCKRELPTFLQQIPTQVWDVLWQSQYEMNPSDPKRSGHLWDLVRDLGRARMELSPVQKMVLMESLHAEEQNDAALKIWHSEKDRFEKNKELAQDFFKLGVQMESSTGDINRAHQYALAAVKDSNQDAVQLFVPVIRGWLDRGDEHGQKTAWGIYLYLRHLKKRNMRLEDYDTILLCFLKGKSLELALAVFKDLVLAGQQSIHDSTACYRKIMDLHGHMESQPLSVADLNSVSLTALSAIPRRFENRYFYASWMKRLIYMGEIHGAASILEIMYRRGLRPDAKHVNGIMGAWLRGTDQVNKELALNIGWAMVNERLKFVAIRRQKPSATDLSQKLIPLENLPESMRKNLPQATIETFSLLLLYYQRRNMAPSIQQVRDCLEEAEIQPNSFFMNHLLYWRLRSGDLGSAWKLFNSMTHYVKPDIETFVCLWECEKSHLGKSGVILSSEFPGPRPLFSKMINWFAGLTQKEKERAKEGFDKDLYDQIMRCMCLRQDIEGTIIALFTLRDSFDFWPSRDTMRMVSIQMARMWEEPPKKGKHRRTRFSMVDQGKKNLVKVTQIIDIITTERGKLLEEQGIDRAKMSEQEQKEEFFRLTAELLRTFAAKKISDPEDLERQLQEIAWEMGAGGSEMSTPLLLFKGK